MMLLCVYCRRTDVPMVLDPDLVPMVAMCEPCWASRVAVPPKETEAAHRYRGRKSDGFGMCSCGELVWECDYAEHVSEAIQEASAVSVPEPSEGETDAD